jgi:phosphomannomutase/phosphoglucomutase
MVIEDIVGEYNGKVHYTRVGSPEVSHAMTRYGILFGGEENGGIMYGPHQPVRDGSMIMALMAELLADKKQPLSRLLSELPYYAQEKDRVYCPENYKEEVLRELMHHVEAEKINTLDGIKLHYSDGSWILIRPSGTEPIFRLFAEAKDKQKVHDMIKRYKIILEEIIENLNTDITKQ